MFVSPHPGLSMPGTKWEFHDKMRSLERSRDGEMSILTPPSPRRWVRKDFHTLAQYLSPFGPEGAVNEAPGLPGGGSRIILITVGQVSSGRILGTCWNPLSLPFLSGLTCTL